jgi:hypothetical protein
MHLFEHPDVGVHLAATRQDAMESMGEELPACERDPDDLRQVPDHFLITVEDEDGGSETKTADEWVAEAIAKGCTGFLFGNHTVHSP